MVNGMPDQKVYANALSLLFLNSTESLGLLKQMYGKVTITPEVEWRLETPPLKRLSPIDLKKHPWIKVAKPEHLHPVVGEAVVGDDGVELFSAAREAKDPLLILDGRIVRQIANTLHFRTTGTLGILLEAKRVGRIPSVLDRLPLLQASGFRMSGRIALAVSLLSGEVAPGLSPT